MEKKENLINEINDELVRFKKINKYVRELVNEQEAPLAAPDAGAIPPPPMGEALPTEGPEASPLSGDTETSENPEVSTDAAETDDTTEELDVTDLVNMTKSIKKQLDDTQGKDTGATEKMDAVFNKLGELEAKLGDMDNVLAKIDELGAAIEQSRPKTPVEKLEMRSLDSYPFNKNPGEFFAEKQQQMRDTGKNEYVLTKGDVENYGKNEIMKSFNPKANENDYNF